MRLSLLYYSPIREQQRRVSRFAITDDHQTRAGEHNKTSNNPYHRLIHSQNPPAKIRFDCRELKRVGSVGSTDAHEESSAGRSGNILQSRCQTFVAAWAPRRA